LANLVSHLESNPESDRTLISALNVVRNAAVIEMEVL